MTRARVVGTRHKIVEIGSVNLVPEDVAQEGDVFGTCPYLLLHRGGIGDAVTLASDGHHLHDAVTAAETDQIGDETRLLVDDGGYQPPIESVFCSRFLQHSIVLGGVVAALAERAGQDIGMRRKIFLTQRLVLVRLLILLKPPVDGVVQQFIVRVLLLIVLV